MIIVTVEYDKDSDALRGVFYTDEITPLCESIAGDVFEEEQSHVEVRVRRYRTNDQHERALSFLIDVSEDTVHHDLDGLARQFVVEIKDQIPNLPPFWVWVRKVPGAFTESN